MQVPSNLFLNKIGKPALYLPTCMVIWGIISGATAGCQSYGGLIAIRFMLGFVEAAYFVSEIYLSALRRGANIENSLAVSITCLAGTPGRS